MDLLEQTNAIDNYVTFIDSYQFPLKLKLISLFCDTKQQQIQELRVTLQVSLEVYQHIETKSLFNLKPDISSNPSNIKFLSESNIIIEATLKPDLIPHLQQQANNTEEAANYLLHLSEQQLDTPLLCTESWLALSVKQQQETGEVGYRTFWSYINPSLILEENNTSEAELTQGITNFFEDLIGNSFDSATKEITEEAFGEISNFWSKLTEDITEENVSLFQTVVNFFTQDDWSFIRIQGDSALRLFYEGKNGKWNCYTQAREAQQQFLFYSICPLQISEAKRMAIAEFITRANYGLIIGNFELDFSDGEVRYKTAIDVEDEELSTETIKKLVYSNVATMDTYLPGIIDVIENNIVPDEAISKIET
ncbi:MAG: YbjN domain-containing protein [Xenococcaceae cyanobacterium MO_207.B15]|nr:YbjN domain-containing protein [Xenococcaceae cyanobacterium MO_207.B15]